jgi:NAD(P)H-dependent FMN reductase
MRILAFAGSLRSGSYNRKLLHLAEKALAGGAEVDHLDLRDVAMPLYDGDLEEREGIPPGARRFKERLATADALLIATPEYNHSVPGTLKNAIDWASRPPDNPFRGKIVLLMGASPGQFGAVRGVLAVRQILTALAAVVIPQTVLVATAGEAFDGAGLLRDGKLQTQVEKTCAELLRVAAALRGAAG